MDRTFEADWRSRFPDTPPLGHRLRQRHPDRWLRVHSLPGSKRYAATEDEVDELLGRSNRTATATLGEGARCWLVVPTYELDAGGRVPELPDVALTPALTVDDPEHDEPLAFQAASVTWRPGGFDGLLRAIADDRRRALWVAAGTGEVFAPYDGGVDLFLASASRRDALRDEFHAWLSPRPDGL